MNTDECFDQAARAARSGELATLERLLQIEPEIRRARDADGHSLLGLACKAATGDIARPRVAGTPEQHAVVDALLRAGADPNAASHEGWAPLHTAAMSGHTSLARRLLAAGAAREGRLYGCAGGSPLALALFYGEREVAELLAQPPIPDNLRAAAALGLPIERFFEGERVSAQAAEGVDFYRPLLVFPEWTRTNSRQELLDEALSWAARSDRCQSLAALVALGANVNANPYRGTPLLWASCMDRVQAVRWLLDHGADPNLRHDFGGRDHGKQATALHLAAQYDCLGCLALLLERGADPTIEDAAYGGTPLGWALHARAERAAELLRAATPEAAR